MDITNLLQMAMGNQMVDGVANQLGIENSQAKSAISAAVPILISALHNNAKKGGEEGIVKALAQHDGSILDDVTGFLKGGNFTDGAGILNHVLGGNQSNVANAVSKSSGLNSGQTMKILAMLAPIVMGYLGKQQGQGGSNAGGLSSVLGGLVSGLANNNSGGGGGFDMSMIENLINPGGSGSNSGGGGLMDIGGKILGGLFGGKK